MSSLMKEHKNLIKVKINQAEANLVADEAHARGHLLNMCEELVHTHPLWSRECILANTNQ
jgi:hypothetical protein